MILDSLRHAWRAFKAVVPKNAWGDHLISWILFVRVHGRLPRRSGRLINDVLFRIKTGGELARPLRHFTSDKELVKLFIKAVVGEEFAVPTIAVLRTPEEVRAFDYPNRCCIKPTHATKRFFIRKAGEPVPVDRIAGWLGVDYYALVRERNYKHLEPKIIVEPLVFDSENATDYKFYCHNGRARLIQVDIDRATNRTENFFDTDWNCLNFSINAPTAIRTMASPRNLAAMIRLSEAIAAHFWLVRVDLYTDGENILVGEITHCSNGANGVFYPRDAEERASAILFAEP